jgi:hypothetical protein
MKTWLSSARIVSGVVVLAGLQLAVIPSAGQAPASPAAKTADGKPNFNGIWQAVNTANWDLEDHLPRAGVPQLGVIGVTPPGQGVVEGGEIPYQPAAAKKKQENFRNRTSADPEAKCYPPGVPRATYLPYPFQMIQSPKTIFIGYGVGDFSRKIHLDKVEPPPIDTWMGRSLGRFEGQTLVVDVTGLNGQAWLDRAGNFASENVHIVERYTLITPYHIQYEATIEDPTVFTRPWKISMPLYRRMEPNVEILEFKCAEFSEELLYGHLRK